MTMKIRIPNPESRKTSEVRAARGGFTLVEIMLAMGIFAMIMTAIYASWTSVMKGAKAAHSAAAAVQRSRVAVRSIQEALLTAQVYNANPQLYWFVADTSGQFASLDMVAHLPETFPGSGLFREQSLRHIRFSVEPDEEFGNKLVLRQWYLLAPSSGAESKPYTIVLGRNVDVFELQFWDSEKQNWMKRWKDTNQFPKLVYVAVGMGNSKNIPLDQREVTTRYVAPAAMMVPRELQNSTMPPTGLPPGGIPINPNNPTMQPIGQQRNTLRR